MTRNRAPTVTTIVAVIMTMIELAAVVLLVVMDAGVVGIRQGLGVGCSGPVLSHGTSEAFAADMLMTILEEGKKEGSVNRHKVSLYFYSNT